MGILEEIKDAIEQVDNADLDQLIDLKEKFKALEVRQRDLEDRLRPFLAILRTRQ